MATSLSMIEALEATFAFEAEQHPLGDLLVVGFESAEELSRPFELEVELATSLEVDVDPASLLGQPARLTLRMADGADRFFCGVVAHIKAWEESVHLSYRRRYRVKVVPRLWLLGHVRRSRIFQGLSVPEIAQQVLSEAAVDFRTALGASRHPEREYCVQFQESDLDFLSRILEEEGIFYFHEHADGAHTLVLGDGAQAHPDVPGLSMKFRESGGDLEAEEHADAFSVRAEIRPSAVTLRDYDYDRPAVDLTQTARARGAAALPELEIYEYPGRYADPVLGGDRARIRLEEHRVGALTAAGAGDVRRLAAGHVVELEEHPIPELNRKWLLTSVRQQAQWTDVLGLQLVRQTGRKERYRCEFTCIPHDVPFRPARLTPRPYVSGPQTAMVVGRPGEEIHTDAQARVKVQFHWDREGQRDDHSSCWIRVAQPWAGPGFGALYLPRVGHEVVVTFVDGDPDRPLITGSVYNGAAPPPLLLPDEKTRTTLRTSSSPGGAGGNELRFEDAAGSEEVFLHAQKDLRVLVKNDKTERVEGNEDVVVERDRSRSVGGDHSLDVGGDETVSIGGSQEERVAQDRATTIGGNLTESVGGNHVEAIVGNRSLAVGAGMTETVALAKALAVGGAYSLQVAGTLTEVVGDAKAVDVAGATTVAIAADKKETVGGDRSVRVSGNLAETVTGGWTLKVDGDLSIGVGGKLTQDVTGKYALSAKQVVIEAKERFALKVGSATLEVTKSGDVLVNGSKIELNASGDLVLKAGKIQEN